MLYLLQYLEYQVRTHCVTTSALYALVLVNLNCYHALAVSIVGKGNGTNLAISNAEIAAFAAFYI